METINAYLSPAKITCTDAKVQIHDAKKVFHNLSIPNENRNGNAYVNCSFGGTPSKIVDVFAKTTFSV